MLLDSYVFCLFCLCLFVFQKNQPNVYFYFFPILNVAWLLPLLLGISILGASFAMFIFTKMKVNLAVMSIGIDYFQVLSMFSKAKVRWPPEIKWLFHQLQWFSFDVDMTGPEW